MNTQILLFVALAAVTAGALGYGIFYNSIANSKKTNERMKSLKDTLKNVDAQRAGGKKAAKPNIATMMVQAGMTTSMKKFYILSVLFGIFVFFASLIFSGLPFYVCIGIGFVAGFGVPRWVVAFKRKRRFRRFILIFPNSIDIIVRGIKSGLPLNDCLRIIANDSEEPVRSEFQKLVESAQMGITVPEACDRLYQSVPTPETNFFAIVIAIQSSAGGNLSEALANLSKVLRERRKMSDKIQAFSSEAKTSAIIIGSLPFIVATMIAVTTPGYLDPLFETETGNKILIGCATAMSFGVFIMKKMINFKF